jgi:hypothetical protein
VRAKCTEDDERMAYRAYVTESLRLQGENKYIQRSWMDIINPKPVDTRTGDEIALQVIKNAGLHYKGGE